MHRYLLQLPAQTQEWKKINKHCYLLIHLESIHHQIVCTLVHGKKDRIKRFFFSEKYLTKLSEIAKLYCVKFSFYTIYSQMSIIQFCQFLLWHSTTYMSTSHAINPNGLQCVKNGFKSKRNGVRFREKILIESVNHFIFACPKESAKKKSFRSFFLFFITSEFLYLM